MRTCSVEGCNGKHVGKGYCRKHYSQYRRHGHILERTTRDLNEIIEYEDYAEMVLYDKQSNEVARVIIDLDDIDKVKQYKWTLSHGYAISSRHKLCLHRFVMGNPEDSIIVDHINRDRLDNRKCNLRFCNLQENNMNKGIQSNNSSGYPGVSYSKNKWRAYIGINGKQIHLGRYSTLEEAIEARKQAEIEYFGEFAPTEE